MTNTARKLTSWINSFIEATSNVHSPEIFRRWTAISVIAATLEQKVWVKTSSPLYPNLYTMIVGHPGVGKTRTIREGRNLISTLAEPHLAPISMTFAALVDCLIKSKRTLNFPGQDPNVVEYNSMYICADEMGAFIHKYDNEMTDGLSAFYDPDPYQQARRGSAKSGNENMRLRIRSPQLNLFCGSTPQNLSDLMPDKAWGQGFTSRLIMVFSDERIVGDDFAIVESSSKSTLEADLALINSLYGQFHVAEEYRRAVNNWRELGEPPLPNHPKLLHYLTRRRTHLYKLSMVSAVDRSNALVLTAEDFNTAMSWLLEAESTMPDIFKAGATNADGQAMEEIRHFVMFNDRGEGVSEQKIVRFAQDRLPIHSITRAVEIMKQSGQIYYIGTNKITKIKYYSVKPPKPKPQLTVVNSDPLP